MHAIDKDEVLADYLVRIWIHGDVKDKFSKIGKNNSRCNRRKEVNTGMDIF